MAAVSAPRCHHFGGFELGCVMNQVGDVVEEPNRTEGIPAFLGIRAYVCGQVQHQNPAESEPLCEPDDLANCGVVFRFASNRRVDTDHTQDWKRFIPDSSEPIPIGFVW